jgi:hypothetical protein
MLTAHLPSGYCLARTMRADGVVLLAALLGAVLPDIDLTFFYLVDGGSIHHHRYWLHVPAFWIAVGALVWPVLSWVGHGHAITFFLGAVFLHLLLDSIGGGIMWLYPWDNTLYEMVTVPASRSHWIWSFVFHWTFGLELAIWIAAALLWHTARRHTGDPA